jgi:multiple sugar transport system ATP-binding protein
VLGDYSNVVDGTVDVIEQLGSEMYLELCVGAAHLTIARVSPTTAVRARDKVKVTVLGEALHFFDAETELAI